MRAITFEVLVDIADGCFTTPRWQGWCIWAWHSVYEKIVGRQLRMTFFQDNLRWRRKTHTTYLHAVWTRHMEIQHFSICESSIVENLLSTMINGSRTWEGLESRISLSSYDWPTSKSTIGHRILGNACRNLQANPTTYSGLTTESIDVHNDRNSTLHDQSLAFTLMSFLYDSHNDIWDGLATSPRTKDNRL